MPAVNTGERALGRTDETDGGVRPVLRLKNFLYLGQDFHGAEGFDDVFIGARAASSFLLCHLPFGGQHDHVDVLEVLVVLDDLAYLIAVHDGHHDVEKQDMGVDVTCFYQRLSAVFGQPELVTFILEEIGERLPDVLVVVGYENLFLRHRIRVWEISGQNLMKVNVK